MSVFAKTIVAPFTNAGVPALGLVPTIDIWNALTGTIVVSAAAMAEVAGGWYRYVFTTFDDSLAYVIRMNGGGSLPITDRYLFATAEAEDRITIKEAVDAELSASHDPGSWGQAASVAALTAQGFTSARAAMIELSKQMLINRLDLEDGDTGNWVLYADDDVTPLLTFNVVDKDGNAILLPKKAPARRTRGV